jgi:hypothetical protein
MGNLALLGQECCVEIGSGTVAQAGWHQALQSVHCGLVTLTRGMWHVTLTRAPQVVTELQLGCWLTGG